MLAGSGARCFVPSSSRPHLPQGVCVPLRLHVTPSVRCLSSRTRRSVLAAGTAAPFAITADDAPFVSNNANVLIGHRPPPARLVPIGILLDSLAGRSREAVARAADDAGRFVRVRMQEQRAA